MFAFLGLMLGLPGLASAGTGVGFWDDFIGWMGATVAIVLGLLVLLYMFYRGKSWDKARKWMVGGFGVFLLVGGVASTAVMGGGGNDDGPGVVPGHHSPITLTVPTTRLSTENDVIAEITDTDGFTAASTVESPAATLCVYNTNAFINTEMLPLKLAWEATVDNDVTTATIAFNAPDVCGIDLQIQIEPYDGNGDGVADQQTIYTRAMVSHTTYQDTNSSEHQVYVWEAQAGSYITGFNVKDTQTTTNVWYSFWPASESPGGQFSANTWSNWKAAGTTTGTDADPEFLGFFAQMRNFGFFTYNTPPLGGSTTITYQFAGPDKDPNACGAGGDKPCQLDVTITLRARD
jgi:hypothetical protein